MNPEFRFGIRVSCISIDIIVDNKHHHHITMVVCNPYSIDLKGLINGPPASLLNKDKQIVPSVTARLLVDCRCHLGECVIWDDRQNAVLFTSILDRKFHKLFLSSDGDSSLKSYSFDKMIGAFGLLDTRSPLLDDNSGQQKDYSNPGYIVAWENGFQLYDLEGGRALGSMSEGEVVNGSGLPARLNDGRVDPTGKRFVCGGCASPDIPMKVYKCEYDVAANGLKHTVIYDEIRTTNSICWSLTGEEMYLADSPSKNIRKFNYDLNTGTLTNERVIHTKKLGFPDGYVVQIGW